MNRLRFQQWRDLAKRIADTPSTVLQLTCPSCGEVSIDSQYVGDLTTKIGYLDIWCANCLRGIHISRVGIPDNVNAIAYDCASEEIAKRIPNFKQVG